MSKGLLFVVSAASGTGKTTIIQKLLARPNVPRFSVSHTTRPPRPGEVDGREYHFVGETTFDRMVAEDAFVEWATVHQYRYGTSRRELEGPFDSAQDRPVDILLDVDVKGAANIRRLYPDRSVLIFIAPPSFEVLERRLAGRGTESDRDRERRLETAMAELALRDRYDYVVVNDRVDRALKELEAIVAKERARARGEAR